MPDTHLTYLGTLTQDELIRDEKRVQKNRTKFLYRPIRKTYRFFTFPVKRIGSHSVAVVKKFCSNFSNSSTEISAFVIKQGKNQAAYCIYKIKILWKSKKRIFISLVLIIEVVIRSLQPVIAEEIQPGIASGFPHSSITTSIINRFQQQNHDSSTQLELVSKSGQHMITNPAGKISISIPRGGDNNQPGKPSKFGPGSKAKGAARRDFFARRRQAGNSPTTTSRQSGGGFFADALTLKPNFSARPGRNRYETFIPPNSNPYNPGCAGGPRSITVLSQSKSSEYDSVREITAHDGVKGKFSDKSLSHLTSKHGDAFGIDDPLPANPKQKPTKYKQPRTRVNKENKEKFGDNVEEILQDATTQPYPEITIRGIKSHGYYTTNYGESGLFVGIHTEGEFAGQIKKAQPISDEQLKILEKEKRMD